MPCVVVVYLCELARIRGVPKFEGFTSDNSLVRWSSNSFLEGFPTGVSGVAKGLVDWILLEILRCPLQAKWLLRFRLVLCWPLYIVYVLAFPLL